MRVDDLPVLAFCGWSGSGKTTLLEAIVTHLVARGLRVALVKHDAHGIQVDRPGKDSDRFFTAGADVLLQGPDQGFFRTHGPATQDELLYTLAQLAGRYDLVLVEGHKGTPLRKLWLLADNETAPPDEVDNIAAVLGRDCDRLAVALPIVEQFLGEQWLKTPVLGCVLIGGKSSRMGTPKHLLETDGKTWLARTVSLLRPFCQAVVISGPGLVPKGTTDCIQLADAPGAEGPISGLLATMRWSPRVSLLAAACDLPELSSEALQWLLDSRRPGVWATLPQLADSSRVEPMLAHYDFRSRDPLELQAAAGNFKLVDLALHPKVSSPIIPAQLAAAWKNVNTAADLASS